MPSETSGNAIDKLNEGTLGSTIEKVGIDSENERDGNETSGIGIDKLSDGTFGNTIENAGIEIEGITKLHALTVRKP